MKFCIYYTETDWEKDPYGDVTVKKITTINFPRNYQANIAVTGLEMKKDPDALNKLYKTKKDQTLYALKDKIERYENMKNIELVQLNV